MRSRCFPWLVSLAALALALAGCLQDPDDGATTDGGADAIGDSGECTPAATRCHDATIEVCLPDGSGWSTQSECAADQTCHDGACCLPNCLDKVCGPDGCGGSCGSCPGGVACEGGKCDCVPSCAGVECGDDGCGGSCGNCDVKGACEIGICTPAGACAVADANDGTPCDDWDECTSDDRCEDGACLGVPLIVDDDNVCTDDSCGPEGITHVPVEAGTTCLDGDFCTVNDACQAGECVGEPRDCDDANPCTADSCDAEAESCVFDGGAMDGMDCSSICLPQATCDDGACVGEVLDCDDDNECTEDSCEDPSGCQNNWAALAGQICDDGLFCTLVDTCQNGACVGEPSTPCDDGDPCTLDLCEEENKSCANLPAAPGSECDDGNDCTENDECKASGECVGTWIPGCS